jgi:hypothetical protein
VGHLWASVLVLPDPALAITLLKSSGVPAQDVLALARPVIEARLAQRQGDKAAAIERFERARELQDGLPTS